VRSARQRDLPPGKPPEMKHAQPRQHAPVVYGQGITVESLDPRLAVFVATFDLFWSLHRGLYPSNRHHMRRESGSTGGLV
jgi:hypothetical protein